MRYPLVPVSGNRLPQRRKPTAVPKEQSPTTRHLAPASSAPKQMPLQSVAALDRLRQEAMRSEREAWDRKMEFDHGDWRQNRPPALPCQPRCEDATLAFEHMLEVCTRSHHPRIAHTARDLYRASRNPSWPSGANVHQAYREFYSNLWRYAGRDEQLECEVTLIFEWYRRDNTTPPTAQDPQGMFPPKREVYTMAVLGVLFRPGLPGLTGLAAEASYDWMMEEFDRASRLVK